MYQPPQRAGVRPKAIALGTADERQAIQKVLQIRSQETAQAPGSLQHEITLYLARRHKAGHQADSTTDDARRSLRAFAAFVGPARSISSVCALDCERWTASLKESGYTANTISSYGGRVKAFWNALVAAEKITRSPFSLQLPKPRRTRKNVFCTPEQRDQLLTACAREDLQFVLWCGFHAGMRRIEIDNARPEWFQWDAEKSTGRITVGPGPGFTPKGLHRRIIPLPSPFVAFLEAYGRREPYMLRPERTKGRNRYRWDMRRPWEEFTAEQELSWVTPHIMRHTYATLHIRAGTPPAVLAQWFGAELKVVMDIYTGFFPDQDVVDGTL